MRDVSKIFQKTPYKIEWVVQHLLGALAAMRGSGRQHLSLDEENQSKEEIP